MSNDIVTIDNLLLSLYKSSIRTEIIVEKIGEIYNRVLFVDYSAGDIYNLQMNTLWELYYVNGYIKITQETIIPKKILNNKKISESKTQQVFSISDKGKDYIKFKYPNAKP